MSGEAVRKSRERGYQVVSEHEARWGFVHEGIDSTEARQSLADDIAKAIREAGREATVSLDECPPGLFWFGDMLGFKSEYATVVDRADGPFRQVDAYVVESGEYFQGGTGGDSVARGKLRVVPTAMPSLRDAKSPAPSPAPMAGGETVTKPTDPRIDGFYATPVGRALLTYQNTAANANWKDAQEERFSKAEIAEAWKAATVALNTLIELLIPPEPLMAGVRQIFDEKSAWISRPNREVDEAIGYAMTGLLHRLIDEALATALRRQDEAVNVLELRLSEQADQWTVVAGRVHDERNAAHARGMAEATKACAQALSSLSRSDKP